MRKVLVAAIVACLALSLSGARASNHCDEPEGNIWLLSGRGFSFYTGSVGCDNVGSDDPATPWDDSDTDYVNPGSSAMLVRWQMPYKPIQGKLVAGEWTGSTLTFAGRTTGLRWTAGTDLAGEPTGGWDSQTVSMSVAESVNGGQAVATLCFDAEAEEAFGTPCLTRAFRTVAAA